MKEESKSNDSSRIIAQALEEMKAEIGEKYSLEKINLAELERRTGISRARLRRLKSNGFKEKPNGNLGKSSSQTIIRGFEGVINGLLAAGVTNTSVILSRISELGYKGSLTTVKRYIAAHKDLVPPKRLVVAPQGNRGRRYSTGPGESYQMDWGFVKVADRFGNEYQTCCFAMICHHCGQRYIEILPVTQVKFSRGESVFEILQRTCRTHDIPLRYTYTVNYGGYYVSEISGLREIEHGALSGWLYRVNGWYPNYGSSKYEVNEGDVIVWVYTCDGGADLGRGEWITQR